MSAENRHGMSQESQAVTTRMMEEGKHISSIKTLISKHFGGFSLDVDYINSKFIKLYILPLANPMTMHIKYTFECRMEYYFY